MVVPKYVQPIIVSLTYSNTGLHYTYGRATLSGAYVCSTESVGYTLLTDVQP